MNKNQKLTIIVVAVVIVLVALAVGRWRSSRDVLEKAVLGMTMEESWHVRSELVLHLPRYWRGGQERPFQDVLARVEGDVRYTEDGRPELTGSVYSEAKGKGNIFFADGDVRLLNNEVLFNLESLPVLLNPSGSLGGKWTKVDTALLTSRKLNQELQVFGEVFEAMEYKGRESREGERYYVFKGGLTAELEDRLVELWREGSSGSKALNVLARLLRANDVSDMEILVDAKTGDLANINVGFVRRFDNTQGEAQEFDFARLDLRFSDFGKAVEIDRPEFELTVRPEVFAKLFGSGDISQVKE